jgi:hypothetical protein
VVDLVASARVEGHVGVVAVDVEVVYEAVALELGLVLAGEEDLVRDEEARCVGAAAVGVDEVDEGHGLADAHVGADAQEGREGVGVHAVVVVDVVPRYDFLTAVQRVDRVHLGGEGGHGGGLGADAEDDGRGAHRSVAVGVEASEGGGAGVVVVEDAQAVAAVDAAGEGARGVGGGVDAEAVYEGREALGVLEGDRLDAQGAQ